MAFACDHVSMNATPNLIGELEPFIHASAITLTQAAQRIRGQRNGRLNREVAALWARVGYAPRGWTGARLKIPTILMGNARMLMPQWLEAWEAARVKMGEAKPAPARSRTMRQATAGHRRAVAQLEREGFTVGGKGAA